MERVWIPSLAVLACVVVGVELDHVPRSRAPTVVEIGRRVPDAVPPEAQPAVEAVCWWRPAADDQPVGPWSLHTVRSPDGATLHTVVCTDGWRDTVWLTDPRRSPPPTLGWG